LLSVNLLPESMRKGKGVISIEADKALIVGIVVNGFALLVVLSLFITSVKFGGELQAINSQLHALKSLKEEAIQLQELQETLVKRTQIIDELVSARILWSEKLCAIGDTIPDNVWLISLAPVERTIIVEDKDKKTKTTKSRTSKNKKPPTITEKYFIIEGAAMPEAMGKGELRAVAEFMERLKENEAFFKDFTDIRQDGPIQWDPAKGASFFTLKCKFRKGV